MFEKEAEKWTIDYVCKDCSRYKECRSKEQCTCKECSKEKWQKGAEFGYIKGNEQLTKAKELIDELEKENAKLKKQVENRNCSNCRLNKTGCPNDGSCHNFSLWQPFINPKLTKAKEIIKRLHDIVCGKSGDDWELIEEVEQFISEVGK